jgi:hypothetical protein
MKKVSDKDFAEMNTRLRTRAAGILKRLDRGAGYRDEIERELEKRLGANANAGTRVPVYEGKSTAPNEAVAGANFSSPRTCTCGTANDPDARFCKTCGNKLEAA